MRLICAFDIGPVRSGAGCDHEFVVVDALATNQSDFAARMGYFGNFGAGANLDIAVTLEVLRRVRDELRNGADLSFDVVRQPASAVGDDFAFFQNDDFERVIDAACTRGSAQARSHTTDDDEPHGD